MSLKSKPVDIVDSLLGNYSPKGATFKIALPQGEELEFKSCGSYRDLTAFKKGAQEFIKSALKTPAPAWKDLAPKTEEEALAVYMISELSVAPKFDLMQALKLMQAPFLIEYLVKEIENGHMAFLGKQAETVEELKND